MCVRAWRSLHTMTSLYFASVPESFYAFHFLFQEAWRLPKLSYSPIDDSVDRVRVPRRKWRRSIVIYVLYDPQTFSRIDRTTRSNWKVLVQVIAGILGTPVLDHPSKLVFPFKDHFQCKLVAVADVGHCSLWRWWPDLGVFANPCHQIPLTIVGVLFLHLIPAKQTWLLTTKEWHEGRFKISGFPGKLGTLEGNIMVTFKACQLKNLYASLKFATDLDQELFDWDFVQEPTETQNWLWPVSKSLASSLQRKERDPWRQIPWYGTGIGSSKEVVLSHKTMYSLLNVQFLAIEN